MISSKPNRISWKSKVFALSLISSEILLYLSRDLEVFALGNCVILLLLLCQSDYQLRKHKGVGLFDQREMCTCELFPEDSIVLSV